MSHHKTPFVTLVERWAQVADDVRDGYSLTFDDYLNDLDLRHRIALRLNLSTVDGIIAAALRESDNRFRDATTESAECVWGSDNARDESWTPEREWYYYRLPIRHAPDW